MGKAFCRNSCYLLVAISCVMSSACTNLANMTISEPKLYTHDEVVRTMAEYRGRIREQSGNLSPASLNELFDANQASRTDVTTSVSPTGSSLVSAPSPISGGEIAFRTPPGANKDIGLPARSMLRNVAVSQEYLMGYDLLFKGDSQFLDPNNQVLLVRFDVSINQYLSRWYRREFAVAIFNITAKCTMANQTEDCSNKLHVYTLFPEYSGISAQDSFLQSNIDSISHQAGSASQGVDLKSARRTQNGLQEQLLQAVEYPLQYAIYNPFPGLVNGQSFGFAFGPRRRIEKRLAINPARWLGSAYTIEYEIEPGPRDLYAVLIAPKNLHSLEVVARPAPYLMEPGDLGKIAEGIRNVALGIDQQFDSFAKIQKAFSLPDAAADIPILLSKYEYTEREGGKAALTPFDLKAQAVVTMSLRPASISFFEKTLSDLIPPLKWTFSTAELEGLKRASSDRPAKLTCRVNPEQISAVLPIAAVLTCDKPLTADAAVFLGPLAVPRDQITLLNRYQLRVGLTPNKQLETLAKATSDKLQWTVLDNGASTEATDQAGTPIPYATSLLQSKVVMSTQDLPFVLSPDISQPQTEVILTLAPQYSGASVTKVEIGSPDPPVTIRSATGSTVTLALPQLRGPAPTSSLPVEVTLLIAGKEVKIKRPNAFTYRTP